MKAKGGPTRYFQGVPNNTVLPCLCHLFLLLTINQCTLKNVYTHTLDKYGFIQNGKYSSIPTLYPSNSCHYRVSTSHIPSSVTAAAPQPHYVSSKSHYLFSPRSSAESSKPVTSCSVLPVCTCYGLRAACCLLSVCTGVLSKRISLSLPPVRLLREAKNSKNTSIIARFLLLYTVFVCCML